MCGVATYVNAEPDRFGDEIPWRARNDLFDELTESSRRAVRTVRPGKAGPKEMGDAMSS